MKKRFALLLLSLNLCGSFVALNSLAQDRLTPEMLWKLGRIGNIQVSPDEQNILFSVTRYDIENNGGDRDLFVLPVSGGTPVQITNVPGGEYNALWRPDGKKIGFLSSVSGSVQLHEVNPDGSGLKQITNISGGINEFKYAPSQDKIVFSKSFKLDETVQDKHQDLPHADARIIDQLMYRHWDSWSDYTYSHICYATYKEAGNVTDYTDIMKDEKFSSPVAPFGGLEQVTWDKQGKHILYTCKKKSGYEWAKSTNTDLYRYSLESEKTRVMTSGMMGYDMNPVFNASGDQLAWVSMKHDGFESDKNDIIIQNWPEGEPVNLTAELDITVADFIWGKEPNTIYYKATVNATTHYYELNIKTKASRQISSGQCDFTSIAQAGDYLVGGRQDMLHPADLYRVNIKSGEQKQLTKLNETHYAALKLGKVEKRMIKTTDGKEMLTWVILPPDFDPNKKYPTLLYCQGGPQAPVSQFFSYRWNFQLMAAHGYIVVAPNRRGLPGFGQEWNDQISKDWGGQAIEDYLSAIDALAKEPYVDEARLGAVGASYGGYSVYFLAGVHQKRFKTFISHCGLFNLESWYGTTEELFFANWDIGGPYWVQDAPKSYAEFSPHKKVQHWDTPILVIHGENDFRVPIGEGMQAFQAAQIMGIPSKFLYFPDEGHWVLSPQNGLLWHREFFSWLDKWLK